MVPYGIGLCLTSPGVKISRSSGLLQMALFCSFCGWVIFHLIRVHVFFIHLSVDGHVGCSHVLATINSAAMSVTSVRFFPNPFSLDVCPGVGLLDRTVALSFLRDSVLFSTAVVPVYLPTGSAGGLLFLPSLPSISCLQTCWCWPSWLAVRMMVWICVPLTISDVERLSVCFWPPVHLLWRCKYSP